MIGGIIYVSEEYIYTICTTHVMKQLKYKYMILVAHFQCLLLLEVNCHSYLVSRKEAIA